MIRITYAFVLVLTFPKPASPADLQAPAIPNFHLVNEHIFRGGQPATQAWSSLARTGVTLVIDLRREDEHSSAAEERTVRAAGMSYINVPMKGVAAPSGEQIAKLLSLLSSQETIFVHCQRGADRTGAVIACYRIEHDHWDRKRALNEAKLLGMAWDQFGLKRYIMGFQPVPDRVSTTPVVLKQGQ
jgi:protein tyrosine/serine phosphatase